MSTALRRTKVDVGCSTRSTVTPLRLHARHDQTDRRIAAIATGQLGAFSRAQAHDAGLSDRQLRSRVQSGFLIQTGPNGISHAGAPTTFTPSSTTCYSISGSRSSLCPNGGRTSRLRRIRCAGRITSCAGQAQRRALEHEDPPQRTDRPHRYRCEVDGLPVTSAVRTLLDLARAAQRRSTATASTAPARTAERGSAPSPH